MANSTLNAIRIKIRRLTRSPSSSQITDTTIDEYVNTFIQYDFPEHLRLFNLRQTLTWYTQPNIDEYNSSSVSAGLSGFIQSNLTVHPPVFIAGQEVVYSQSRSQFAAMFPLTNTILSIGTTGDGITTAFAGTLSSIPVLRNNVNFVSKDAAGNGLRLSDDGSGVLSGDGTGTINYLNGAFTLAYSAAPGASEVIYSETIPYAAGKPTAVLFFNDTFTIRPVPDKVYPVNIEVNVRPSELLAAGQSPQLEEWWQYIAFSSAKKILEDRMDMESIQMIMPSLKEQERLILRRTLQQLSNQRVATIYSENGNGSGWSPGSSNF